MCIKKILLLVPLLPFIIIGCSDTPPKNPNNLCAIYKEKRKWFKASLKAEKEWGVPPQIPASFIYQESSFKGNALPPRKYLLWIIPWGRVSTSYGYAQAQTSTWNDYIKSSGNHGAKRNNYGDNVDFISWYISTVQKTNGVSKWDAYNQYLNYHEGMGGYRRRTYQSKPWLIGVAKKVQQRSATYGQQYRTCEEQLKKSQSFWEWLFGV